MARQSTKTGHVRRSDLELFMECEEEELTPSQRQANIQAQRDYTTALQNFEKPKTARAPRLALARKGTALSSQVPVRQRRRYASDVIVIDDDASTTTPVFPVTKQGRTSNASRNSTSSTKNSHANFYSSSVRTSASSGGNLIVLSSDVPDIPVTKRSSGGMNIPTNTTSYMTLPTNIQPTFGLPSGRKVLLTVPIDGPADEDFVMSTGVNRIQSTYSLPVNRVHRGRPRQQVINLSIPSTVDDEEVDDDDDVRIVEPFEISERFGSNVVSGRMRLHGPANSHAFETKTSNARKTAVKRSADMVQRVEKQAQSAPKKPRLVASMGRKRQNNRNDDFSWASQTKNHQTSGRPGGRKRQERDINEEDSNSIWIPVDEYYYGKKEGDPSYREDKGEYRFKCWYCHKMLYNNLRLMMHMQGHIDNDKQQNLDLSDLTQCKHCYGQFDTPFEMQCHIEKVHQNKSNILVCRICEKDHDSEGVLRQHMKNFHSSCEMPYTCNLCNFRSSVYSDVVNHFKKRHDSSQYVLCLYCLKTFKISFYKSVGWGMTQTFYQHMQKHQNKSNNKKCICCKLTFLTKQETDHHRARDHLPNYRGTQNSHSTVNSNKEKVLICLKESGVKLLNAPSSSKSCEVRFLQFDGVGNKQLCLECKKPLNLSYHFRNYAECTLCRFATSCSITFSAHMMKCHSGIESKRKALARREAKMETKMFCLCGFASAHGNLLANHLVSCSKRTCYSGQREAKYFEYDDEQEDSIPFEPYIEESEILGQETSCSDAEVPSLFGALGLVKKQRTYDRQLSRTPGPRSRPQVSSKAIVNGIIEDLMDSLFPAEAAASYVLNYLLDQVVKPRAESPAENNSPLTIAGDITDAPMAAVQGDGGTVEPVATSKKSPDYQMMAVDSPNMGPTESVDSVEDFAHSKLNTESIKNELVGVFCDMPDIEQKESSAEFGGSTTVEGDPGIKTLKEDTKQIVKAETSENSEEDDNCNIIDAEIQLSTDDSCIISDDFLISLDDENAEATEDFGEPGSVTENAKETTEVEQSSANGLTYEKQGSRVITNVDDSFCSNTGRNVADLDEKDVPRNAEIIQNYNSADELCKEPNNLHHNSELEYIQQTDDAAEVVVIQEEDSVNTDKICDDVMQEAISRSGFEDKKVSPCPNICDLENEATSIEFIDDYVDELNCEQTSIKEDGLSLISSQGVSSECGTKLAEFTDNLVDEAVNLADEAIIPVDEVVNLVDEVVDTEKVATDGKNSECQTFAGQCDVYSLVSSPLENENGCGSQAGNEASDVCHVVTPCENEIYLKDCCGTELESFHGERTMKLDAEEMTSSVLVNFDGRGVDVDNDKDIETKSNSQSSKEARADRVTKISESRSEVESARLDKGKRQEIPALNDVHAKTTHCPETKIKDPESLSSKSQTSSLEGSSKDGHSSRHRGLMGTSGHHESHKPDTSYYRDRKYKERDERRDNTNYEHREFGPRDYDRRAYNQRDFDRRGYDRQDYGHRDHANRNYRQYDRGGCSGGYKNESYDHGYRHERDDHYDRRDYSSRRDYDRNADQNRNRYNSSSYRRNNYY